MQMEEFEKAYCIVCLWISPRRCCAMEVEGPPRICSPSPSKALPQNTILPSAALRALPLHKGTAGTDHSSPDFYHQLACHFLKGAQQEAS